MKKHKKSIFLFIIALLAPGILFLLKPEMKNETLTELKTPLQAPAVIAVPGKIKIQSRIIATIPSQPAPVKKRKVLGRVKDMNKVRMLNKYSSDWKDKYKKNFQRMSGLSELKNFEVEVKDSIIQVNRNAGRNLEHIVVRLTKPDGVPFSFEALVDSQTGQLVRSWNQSRHEHTKEFSFNSAGQEYSGN